MKEKKLYECDFCKTSFADKAEAMKCEKNHKQIARIQSLRYASFKCEGTGKPITIEVVFTDGSTAIYKR